MPSLNSLGNYCCKRIWPRVNSDPSFLDVPTHKLLAYLQEFGWLVLFGHLSAGDRPNYGSSESRGTRAVAPKSEWQTMNLGRRLSSLELRASIARELCRSRHTFELCSWCWRVWNGQIWRVDPWSPISNQTCGPSWVKPQWSPCLYHPISNLKYSMVATTLQASYSQPWLYGRYRT
jgi:hypothetical protein